MIFKCYICDRYRLWNKKKCYRVVVTSNDGSDELFEKKMCQECGDKIAENYESGKKLAAIEVQEDE